MLSRGYLLLLGILFHLVYLRSIFDIYFKSPVVSVNEHFSSSQYIEAPADRLFLIVGDGLRADKLYENPQLAPFLHERALKDGRWGLSHTRVPTESRPGHVALIAGLYEDVSAVTTGWQLNPVNFDSVFNQSSRTFSWGSPDILPMFREGATNKEHISCYTYDSHAEDFTEDSSKLDTWVFEHVESLFAASSTNLTLAAELKAPKTIFFLHLLGLDTAGHAHRPYSKEYLNNIAIVDAGLSQLYDTLQNIWSEEELARTAFLFTADHGMSDWGSHGDGHPDNTRTPYITWGSGIKKPSKGSLSPTLKLHGTQLESFNWSVEVNNRIDVAQADLAALMAHLIGVNFPKNNVGQVPVEVLASSAREQNLALYMNAHQIFAQYTAKSSHKAAQLKLTTLKDFAFSKNYIQITQELISKENWIELGSISSQWIIESIAGMRYLQKYDWLFLRSIITLGYAGFMLYVVQSISNTIPIRSTSLIFSYLTILCIAYLFERSAPWSYFAYSSFPLFFWSQITRYAIPRPSLKRLILLICVVQAIAYAYTDRRIISLLFILGCSMPYYYSLNPSLSLQWIIACLAMSIFTLLPTVQVESLVPVISGGLFMFIIGLVIIPKGSILRGVQVGIIGLSSIVTYSSATRIQANLGLPLGNQVIGWMILISSLIVPFFEKGEGMDRIVNLFLALSPTFIILAVSYEGLFYISFWALLSTWLQVESEISKTSIETTSPSVVEKGVDEDFRRSLVFFFLIQSAFFGTGNIASVSSFSLESVYRLIPIFNPFLMAVLLLFKLLTPFIVLSAILGVMNKVLKKPDGAIIMLVFTFADLLTLNFFWLVRDEGSWLEIGSSISAFVIAGLLTLFVIALERVSQVIIGDIEV